MEGPIRVLDLFPFGPDERARLDAVSPRLQIEHRDANTQEHIDSLGDPGVEILLASHAPAEPARMPGLRWIARRPVSRRSSPTIRDVGGSSSRMGADCT